MGRLDIDLNISPSIQTHISNSESCDNESEGSTTQSSGRTSVSYDRPSPPPPPSLLSDRLIELTEGDNLYDLIAKRLLSCLGPLKDQYCIMSIHRNLLQSPNGRAKSRAFQIYTEAVERKHGGLGVVRYAWYGVRREDISGILTYGFGEPSNKGFYGRGLYLSPDNLPLECLEEMGTADGDELRFLLLCRVILGKSEVIGRSSDQSCPSSLEFDSGVDNVSSPKKYIIWSTHMNTHVLPQFVVCLGVTSNSKGLVRVADSPKRPRSPWITFTLLISKLSKFLPPSLMQIILKQYKNQREGKISRFELIQFLRWVIGDELLIKIIKSFQSAGFSMPKSRSKSCRGRKRKADG